MGFSSGTIAHFMQLGRAGTIRPRASVLEFGSQDIHNDISAALAKEFAQTFGATLTADRIAALIETGAKAEHLLNAIGFSYAAFDVYETGGTRIFDLNTQSLDRTDVGRFDVVTNYGTSEHVANQYNVFKVAHEALKVGGVMMNSLPFWGHVNHGLINYHPKFFTSLIKENGYKTLYFSFSNVYDGGGDIDRYYDTEHAENGKKWANKYVGCAQMTVMFQKTVESPFKPPVDVGVYTSIGEIYKR